MPHSESYKPSKPKELVVDNNYFAHQNVKLQADRLNGTLKTKQLEEHRGTVKLDN